MLHRFGSSKDEVGDTCAREAEALADKGIASLRISFRSFGKSEGDTANGNWSGFPPLSTTTKTMAVVAAVYDRVTPSLLLTLTCF
jgi:hypothetical protein